MATAYDLVLVEFNKLPDTLKLNAIYNALGSIADTLTSHGLIMSDIKRESGETGAKVDELLNEVGNAVNRLLAINAEKDAVIEQLRAGEIDATEAAAEQDRLQMKIDDEIGTLRQVGVTNIQTPPAPTDLPPTGEDETPPA